MPVTVENASAPEPATSHNIARLLASRIHENTPALVFSASSNIATMTYRKLGQAAARVQAHLRKCGVKEGDRVALSLPNVPLMPALYYGILASGALCVPLNPLLSGAELEHHLQDSGATMLFAWEGTRLAAEAHQVPLVCDGTVHLEILGGTSADPQSSLAPFGTDHPSEPELKLCPVSPADPALILYTSGTTGKPKGATLTHANILSNAQSCAQVFGFTAEDIIFGGLPLFHAFGQTVTLNAACAAGSTIALLPRFTPEEAIKLIDQADVTVLAAVPSMYVALIAALEENPSTARQLKGRIRFGISGGSPLPASAHSAFDALISCPIYEGYGLSETSPVVSFNQAQFGHVTGSVGRVLPGVQVQIRDNEGRSLPAGTHGQLWVSGENIMAGYWNNPQATDEVFDGTWFATGDIARLDNNGNIYIVDRIKDMVLRNGYSVYPREIEDVLQAHPQVRAVAVIGLDDALVGEEITAVVVSRGHKDDESLIQELDTLAREKLAAYKYPRHYRIVDSMPLGPTGKILKHELRAMFIEKR